MRRFRLSAPATRRQPIALGAVMVFIIVLVSPHTMASSPADVSAAPSAASISNSVAIANCQDAPPPVGMKTLPVGHFRPDQPEPPSLAALKSAPPFDESGDNNDEERVSTVRQSAISLGMRAGFNRGIWCHQHEIDAQAAMLSKMYDFGALLFPAGGGYMYEPGIVTEEFNNTAINRDGTKAAAAAARIALLSKEAIVSGPRSWTNYLTFSIEPLAPVDPHTRPRSKDRDNWEKWVADGWNRGLKQAAQTVLTEWSRLDRDYIGMITYTRLVQEKRLDPPRSVVTDKGVTGNHDEVRVGVVDVETVRRGQLQPNAARWQALPFITEPEPTPAPFQPVGEPQ